MVPELLRVSGPMRRDEIDLCSPVHSSQRSANCLRGADTDAAPVDHSALCVLRQVRRSAPGHRRGGFHQLEAIRSALMSLVEDRCSETR